MEALEALLLLLFAPWLVVSEKCQKTEPGIFRRGEAVVLCVLFCFTHMACSLKSRSICCPPVYTRHVFLCDGRQALLISCCPCRTCAGDHTTPCTSPLLRLILHRSSGLVINSSASLTSLFVCFVALIFSNQSVDSSLLRHVLCLFSTVRATSEMGAKNRNGSRVSKYSMLCRGKGA